MSGKFAKTCDFLSSASLATGALETRTLAASTSSELGAGQPAQGRASSGDRGGGRCAAGQPTSYGPGDVAARRPRRQAPGASPTSRLKARLNAASDWYPTAEAA